MEPIRKQHQFNIHIIKILGLYQEDISDTHTHIFYLCNLILFSTIIQTTLNSIQLVNFTLTVANT